jgi:hypothetical protein
MAEQVNPNPQAEGMSDFEREMFGAYDIPNQAKQIEGSLGRHQHSAGNYIGFMGKLMFKYKDHEDKGCSQDTPGAVLSHATLYVYIKKLLGTQEMPRETAVISDTMDVPDGTLVSELYFPVYISLKPSEQWKTERLFEKFMIPGYEKSRIVQPHPSDVRKKIVNIEGFLYHYGMPVRFELQLGKKSGRPYLASISQIEGERIPISGMQGFEEIVKQMVDLERQQRELDRASEEGTHTSTPPSESASDILGVSSGADSGEYDDKDDLPF